MNIVLHDSLEDKLKRVLATLSTNVKSIVKHQALTQQNVNSAFVDIVDDDTRAALMQHITHGNRLNTFYHHVVESKDNKLTLMGVKLLITTANFSSHFDFYAAELTVDLTAEQKLNLLGYAAESIASICGVIVSFVTFATGFSFTGWGVGNLINRYRINASFKDELIVSLKAEFEEMAKNA